MGLKAIPSVVQLPGGVVLQGKNFKIVDRFENGRPKTFELLPSGTKGDFVMYASEDELLKVTHKPQ